MHLPPAFAVPLLFSACDGDRREPSEPEPPGTSCDGDASCDTGAAGDTGPACDTGQLDDGGDCVPAACGLGTWGDLQIDGSTVFVDSAAAEGGDGSELAPFGSIQAGLDAAGAAGGGMVAVAAGTYPENLRLTRAHGDAHLAGRCKELVIIDAGAGEEGTRGIDAYLNSGQAVVSGVTVTGAQDIGVAVGSGTVTLRDSKVVGSGYIGVAAYRTSFYQTSLVVESSEVLENDAVGVYAAGSSTAVTLRGATIADTRSAENGEQGFGIWVNNGASLSAAACALSGNAGAGLFATDSGSTVTLRDTIIEKTLPNGNGEFGYGIEVNSGADLTAEACELSGNAETGVRATNSGTTVLLRETTVQDTQPDDNGDHGYGIEAHAEASLTTEACQVLRNTGSGVLAADAGTTVRLLGTTIQDTWPNEIAGSGIGVQSGASLSAEACELSGNAVVGAYATDSGTRLSLLDSTIQGSLPDENGELGIGIGVFDGASLEAEDCQVWENAAAGISAGDSGTTASLHGTTILDTQPARDGSRGFGIEIFGGASLEAQDCELSENAATGVLATDSGTEVSLRDTTILDTQSDESGLNGFGIDVSRGASLEAEGCKLSGNTWVGVLASDTDTTVILRDTNIQDTQSDQAGAGGVGIQVQGGAALEAEACDVSGNRAAGLYALETGTAVVLRESAVLDTIPDDNGDYGYGIEVQDGASLELEACVLSRNTGLGVVATGHGTTASLQGTMVQDTLEKDGEPGAYGIGIANRAHMTVEDSAVLRNIGAGLIATGPGTSATLRNTSFAFNKRGETYTVGMGVVAQDRASIEAAAIEASANEGPAFYVVHRDTTLTCSGCKLLDNHFAGAVVWYGGSLLLEDCNVEDTAEQENLGGGIGIYAEPFSEGGAPSLQLIDNHIQGNPVAGVWLAGDGSYALSGNAIHGGEGWTRAGLTKCGDAVYAGAGAKAWDGISGLLLEDNALSDGMGAGLFLEDSSASLAGNSYENNAVDLVSQGTGCASPPVGFEGEALGSAELCPSYDYATCAESFALYFELATPEPGPARTPARSERFEPGGLPLPALPIPAPVSFDLRRGRGRR